MRTDKWASRAWVEYISAVPLLLRHARSGRRTAVAKKIVYDLVVARNGVVFSILRDLAGLNVHSSERVLELPLVGQMLRTVDRDSTMLEIGSGDSPMLLQLAVEGYHVIGTDLHPYLFSMSGVEFAVCDVLNLPFRDGSVSVIFTISTIEHVGLGFYGDNTAVTGDKSAMKELHRILESDGRLVLSVPFGSQPIPGFERVYDAETFHNLLGEFKLVAESYWVYENERWTRVQKEEAKVGPPLREGGTMTSGVIIAMATKQV